MRSYGQYCSIAKALDVVGDRWTLLIIRELVIRGACRYTDLKNGLPGIATNLLSDRIRELESAGLIRREDAPPPIATTLFHLTESGAEPLSIELRTASGPAVIEISGGSAHTRLGTAAAPDLILQGEPQLILALLAGRLTAAEAAGRGLQISGDTGVLHRVLPEPAVAP